MRLTFLAYDEQETICIHPGDPGSRCLARVNERNRVTTNTAQERLVHAEQVINEADGVRHPTLEVQLIAISVDGDICHPAQKRQDYNQAEVTHVKH